MIRTNSPSSGSGISAYRVKVVVLNESQLFLGPVEILRQPLLDRAGKRVETQHMVL